MAKARGIPKQRRINKPIFGLDVGLDYSKPSTMISENSTPNCQDVWFRDGKFGKTYGSFVFADTASNPLTGVFMLAKHYVKNNESDKLIAHTDEDVYAYDPTTKLFESILGDETLGGDIDDSFCAVVQNDFYLFSNGISTTWYWDMVAESIAQVDGATGCCGMEILGERVNQYGLTNAPRRVAWTVVGGLTTPTPLGTDWTDAGSGDTDLDSNFGDDVIMCAAKLGNCVVIYGKKNIVMQEYAGTSPDVPYNFYTRVPEIGTPSKRGVINLGDTHVILGWDNIYIYQGGTSASPIGEKISTEFFKLVNPEYINRCFLTYTIDTREVRIYYPTVGEVYPNAYFSINIENKSWSKGYRSYTGSGSYINTKAYTWDTIATDTTTWDEVSGRWDDVKRESLYPIILYGNSSGVVYVEDDLSYNLSGVVIDGFWESKDLIANEEYRNAITNWMNISFEALGTSLDIFYSIDCGVTWSSPTTFTLTNAWKEYSLDININSPVFRIKIGHSELTGTFELRMVSVGYVLASNRGVG